jgi:prepilin-type N-terminal cleavage/methylation domain-containing protein
MNKRWETQGFTIVELLIVIVVIAILAAISVTAYRGVQENAKTSVINDSVQSWESAIHRAAIDGGSLPANGVCLGSANDFPATADFPANACLVVDGAAAASYASSFETNWPSNTTRPRGLLPTTKLTTGGSTYKARGIWIRTVSSTPRSVEIAWIPQVAEKCGSGALILSGSDSLAGAVCSKAIPY